MAFTKMMRLLSIVTVEPVLFFYMFLIFLEINGLQSIFFTKICLQMTHPENKTDCMNKHSTVTPANITAQVSAWDQYYSTCLNVCTLLVCLYVASWSDILGRKVIMLIPAIGTLIAAVINLTLSLYIETHIAFFLISAAVSGFSFGTVGLIASTFGYLSDIISEASTTKRIVVLEAMIFVGGTIGSYVSGEILKDANLDIFFNNYATLFTVEVVIALFIILYVVFRINNVLTPSKGHILTEPPEEITCLQLFSLSHLKAALKTVTKKRPNQKRLKILLLMLSGSLIYVGTTAQFRISFLYTKSVLNWTITDYSRYNSVQFGLEGAALLIGLPIVLNFWNIPDPIIAAISTLSRFAGYTLFGLSYSFGMTYSCAVLFICSEFAIPSVRSMLSKLVEPNEKGRMFAFTTILQNICFFLGALVLPTIFRQCLELPYPGPGIPFEIIGGLQLISVGIFCYIYFLPRETAYEQMNNGVANGHESEINPPNIHC